MIEWPFAIPCSSIVKLKMLPKLLLLCCAQLQVITSLEVGLKPDKSSHEILNDIVNFGLDRTRYLTDVLERKIYDKGLNLQKTDPAHFVAVFNKQKPKSKELAKYGYATLEASSLLTKQ